MGDSSTAWTIERIAETLRAPAVQQRFLGEIQQAPAHELLSVFAKWQHVAADLEVGAERARALLAQAGPNGELPGEWNALDLGEPRPMTATELNRIATRAESATVRPTSEQIDEALRATRAVPEN